MKIEVDVDIHDSFELVSSAEGATKTFHSSGEIETALYLKFRKKKVRRPATVDDIGKEVITDGMGVCGKLLAVHGDWGWMQSSERFSPFTKPMDLIVVEE